MADDGRLLSSVMAQEFGQGIDPCDCGSSINLCRVSRYVDHGPCCEGCVHAA